MPVLTDWCRLRPGYHLYPNRREPSAASVLVIKALRHQDDSRDVH